jgi:hypothetical protein
VKNEETYAQAPISMLVERYEILSLEAHTDLNLEHGEVHRMQWRKQRHQTNNTNDRSTFEISRHSNIYARARQHIQRPNGKEQP